MSQGNLDNRIKEVFESMDEYDQKEALKRKEDIWERTDPRQSKKRDRQWFLILLLGALFFAVGWLSKHTQIIETNSKKPQDKIQSNQTNQFATAIEMTKHIMIEQELDSLIEVNRILSAELSAMNDKYKTIRAPESTTNITYIRDTLYVTEVQIQEQIVERIIKDTILIEVPVKLDDQHVIADVKVNKSIPNVVNDNTAKIADRPSSVQFNFSGANLKEK